MSVRTANAETDVRSLFKMPKKRGRKPICSCGCKTSITHTGLANGLGMTSGCEWSMRVWVKDGYKGLFRLRKMGGEIA